MHRKWQMLKLKKQLLPLDNNATQNNFIATGEVIKFEGFLKVYTESDDEDEEEEDGRTIAYGEDK